MVQLRIFVSFRKEIRRLSYEEKGQLLDAMLAYAEDKTLLPLTGKADVLWDVIQERIDAQHNSYEKMCAVNKENIKKRYESLRTDTDRYEPKQDNLSLLKSNVQVQEQVKVQEQVQDKSSNKRESKRFAPPTVQQVSEYCLENGFGVDPERFVNHYTSNGWKVGGKTPMKDWRAAVRNWETRDKDNNKKAQKNYEQRRITDAMIEHMVLDLDNPDKW
jgi:hypothetical protein